MIRLTGVSYRKYSNLLLWILLAHYSVTSSAQELRYDQNFSSPWFGQVVVENLNLEQQQLLASDSLNWYNILQVYTDNGRNFQRIHPILGSYRLQDGIFGFKPRFPFEQSSCYKAFLVTSSSVELRFCTEAKPAAATENQLTIYPSGSLIPANILRFYLYFDVPMREDNPYQHIHLINAQGDTINNALYPAKPALWSGNKQRLTVLMDPGRVKRGLMANNRWGLTFSPGSNYYLVISRKLKDQWGNPLSEDYKHPLLITEPDYQSPMLNSWNITAPGINTLDQLKIVFGESMDQAQCLRWINVSLNNQNLEGTWELGDNEMWATFVPIAPWVAGTYQVLVFNKLEDRSGNSIRKPFETTQSTDVTEDAGWESLDFEIK